MKIRILDDEFMVCGDCVQPIVYGDYSALDYHYNTLDSEKRYREICEGIERNCKNGFCSIEIGDNEKNVEFSKRSCDCCGSELHGHRTHFVIYEV